MKSVLLANMTNLRRVISTIVYSTHKSVESFQCFKVIVNKIEIRYGKSKAMINQWLVGSTVGTQKLIVEKAGSQAG